MSEKQKQVLEWVVLGSIIALVLVVMLILFGNLSSNLGFKQDSITNTVTNETNAYLNETGYTLAETGTGYSNWAIIAIWGMQGGEYNVSIPAANATVNSLGVVTNLTSYTNSNVSFSYTDVYSYNSAANNNTQYVLGNYTQAAVNTASQLPTVGTITGIAFLLLILIGVIVFAVKRLGHATSNTRGDFG